MSHDTDIAALKLMYEAQLAVQQEANGKLLGMQPIVDGLRRTNESLVAENEQLAEQVAILMKRLYGKRSEKIDPNQLNLFTGDIEEIPEPKVEEVAAHKRKRSVSGHGRRPFPEHLQRAERVCDLAESDKVCDCLRSRTSRHWR